MFFLSGSGRLSRLFDDGFTKLIADPGWLISICTGEVIEILVSVLLSPKIYPASFLNQVPESSLLDFADEYTVARVAEG